MAVECSVKRTRADMVSDMPSESSTPMRFQLMPAAPGPGRLSTLLLRSLSKRVRRRPPTMLTHSLYPCFYKDVSTRMFLKFYRVRQHFLIRFQLMPAARGSGGSSQC